MSPCRCACHRVPGAEPCVMCEVDLAHRQPGGRRACAGERCLTRVPAGRRLCAYCSRSAAA